MSGSRPKVYVSRGAPSPGLARLKEQCDVAVYDKQSKIPIEDLKRAVAGVDAIFVHPPDPINKEVLDAAGPQLKVVVSMSAGLDHIDLAECRKRGIPVGYTPELTTKPAAEMAVLLTLTAARRIKEAFQAIGTGVWGWENAMWLVGKQISGSVIGIVGLGKIGLATAKRLKAFEPSRMLYCGNSEKKEADTLDARFVSFDELLKESDIVVATCAITPATKGMFNKEAFQKMKKGSVFVNVTRGSLVDQDALYDALSTNHIAAAGIDVTTPEPLPTSHKLLTLPNCVVTPHVASATLETRNAMCELAVDNVLAGLQGKPLPSPAY